MQIKLYDPCVDKQPITLRLVLKGESIILASVDEHGDITPSGRLISIDCESGKFSRVEGARVPGLSFESGGRIIITN